MGMPYVRGLSREEVFLLPDCLDDYIERESEVRFIEAFVEQCEFPEFASRRGDAAATVGRPSYDPADMLKLWIWGYVNRVVSSRRLERECGRNLEVIWLLRKLRPDHWTICAFRRNQRAALKKVGLEFIRFCKDLGLIGGKLLVIDGTKIKAVNNPSRKVTAAEVAKDIARLEKDLDEYVEAGEQSDAQEEAPQSEPAQEEPAQSMEAGSPPLQPSPEGALAGETLPPAAMQPSGQSAAPAGKDIDSAKRAALEAELLQAREWQAAMQASGRDHLSLTDHDARPLTGVGSGYNIQVAVDSPSHFIVVDDLVDSANDLNALVPIAEQGRERLELGAEVKIQLAADTGYHTRESLAAAEAANFEAFVPRPKKGVTQEKEGYHKSKFSYDAQEDAYRCPSGALLRPECHFEKRGLNLIYYSAPAACRECPFKTQCTKSKYRRIERWEHEAILERAEQRLAANPEMMKRRKGTVEHVFGTIKFWNNQGAFLTRGFAGVSTEFSLSVLAYNIKHLLKMMPLSELLAKLRERKAARAAKAAEGFSCLVPASWRGLLADFAKILPIARLRPHRLQLRLFPGIFPGKFLTRCS